MNRYFKALSLVAAIAGLYVPAVAVAQRTTGGVTGEARLHPGTWNTPRSSRSFARSRPMYRSTSPVIVRTEPAPIAVAQAPTEQRSFSYEPSMQAGSVAGGCGDVVVTEQAPATAQQSTEAGRSFSYEPSMSDSAPATSGSYLAPRSYSAPRMRSSGSSRLPSFLGPKAERNKYRN